jgi:hypothetical protein
VRGTLAAILAAALAGCVSAPSDAPAWFVERDRAEDGAYPSLRSVPRTTVANTDANHWRAVERDVVAAGQAMKTNPRAEPAPPTDPEGFIAEAREELEETRDAHPD